FFAQGYCAAKDRLFQFEIWRRQATGTVAEILGPRELQRDIGTRLFLFRGDMDKELNHYHAQGKEIILAFTDGVNAYIDEAMLHPEQLPAEFHLLNIRPAKWTPAVVISRHQGILGNATEELNIGRVIGKIGEEKLKQLIWLHPGDPLLQPDSTINTTLLEKDILALYNAYRKDIVFEKNDIEPKERASHAVAPKDQLAFQYSRPFPEEQEGSNNWVVSPGRSANGHALLASDPHRKIAIPSLRYVVHLSAPGWNVMGGGEPEIPGVAIGHNEHGAWGFTIHQTDAEDLYVYELNPSDLSQYKYKGSWQQMKEIREEIRVKGSSPVPVTLRYTIHGPVSFIDTANHKAYAMRAAWLEPGAAPYLSSLRIDQAKDWTSFRKACSYSYIPSLNMVWADKKGNIGWQVVGIIPQRKNFSGLVPLPGDGHYEWSGYLPVTDRPHDFNPAKGFIATANENLIPPGFAHGDAAGFMWPDAYRGQRIDQVLRTDNKMTMGKMLSLQTDYLSLPAKELVPFLQNILFTDTIAMQAKKSLLDWNFVMDRSSIGAAIYAKWEKELMLEANLQFVPASARGLITLQTTRVISWIKKPNALLFGPDSITARDVFLQKTFTAAITKLKEQLGSDISKWQYGQDKYKHIRFIHPLTDLLQPEWAARLNTTSLPRAGYGHTVGATGNMDNQGNGASFRYIANTADWDDTRMINAPGQSGDPASKWYKNLFELWAADQYFPAYFTRKKIESVTAERIELIPLQR
ncbi:MAG: penicillin acylase family protein, partial [Chitinophagaceae bacterium]